MANTLLYSIFNSSANERYRLDLIGDSYTGLNDLITSFGPAVVLVDGDVRALISVSLAIVVKDDAAVAPDLNRTIDSFSYNSTTNKTTIVLDSGTVTSAYDRVVTADAPSFEITTGSLSTTYENEGDEVLNALKASTTSWDFYNQNKTASTGADYWINRYKFDPENEWYLRVQKWNGASYDLYWVGNVINDNVTWDNTDQPKISIKAIDGIGRLKDLDFDQVTDGTITSEKTLLDYAIRILSYNNLSQFWGASDIYIEESIEYTEGTSIMDATNGPLENTRTRPETFIDRTDRETEEAISCEEALLAILELFRARIVHTEGKYKIMQVRNYTSTTYNYRAFYKGTTAAPDATGTRTHQKTLGGPTAGLDLRTLGGGEFGYFPGLNKATTDLRRGTRGGAQAWGTYFLDVEGNGLGTNTTTDTITFPDVIGGTGRTIRIDIRINSAIAPTGSYMDIELELDDGTNYFRQPLGGLGSWTTTNTDTGFARHWQNNNVQIVSFVTPNLPGTGTSDYTATLKLTPDATVSSGELFEIEAWTAYFPVEGEELDTEEVSVTNPTSGYSKELELSDLRIIDFWAQSSLNRLQVRTSTGPDVWGVAGPTWDGGYGISTDFLARIGVVEAMALQYRPLETYSGGIVGDYLPTDTLVYNYKTYAMNGCTFDYNMDQWAGTWFEVSPVLTGYTVDTDRYPADNDEGGTESTPLAATQNENWQEYYEKLTTVSADLTSSPVTSISIAATGHTRIKSGDTIYLVHPTNGNVLGEYVVSADVTAVATSISVTSTPLTDDIPANSWVNFNPAEVVQSEIIRVGEDIVLPRKESRSVAVNTTLVPTDYFIEVTAASKTITLPTLAACQASPHREFVIFNTSAGDTIIQPNGSENIMGAGTAILVGGDSYWIFPAVTEWRIL